MKKWTALLLAVLFTVFCPVSAFAAGKKSSADYPIDTAYYEKNPYRGTTLNVYNWGEYISDGSEVSLDVNQRF